MTQITIDITKTIKDQKVANQRVDQTLEIPRQISKIMIDRIISMMKLINFKITTEITNLRFDQNQNTIDELKVSFRYA